VLSRPLISDNGASIKGKDVHFAPRRLICYLSRYCRLNRTNEGYALLIEFSKFFDNIGRETLFGLIGRRIKDTRIHALARHFVSAFGAGKSLGLGIRVSQISTVFYPDRLDHYIKEKLRIKYCGRYMDDLYLMHERGECLQECLKTIMELCAKLKLTVNTNKTRVVKLSSVPGQ
jgi:hypothetical protein